MAINVVSIALKAGRNANSRDSARRGGFPMSLAELIRTYWPIATFLTPFLLAGGFAWLRMQFPTKADLERLRHDRVEAVAEMRGEVAKEIAGISILARTTADRQLVADERIAGILVDLARAPSKIELSKDIGKVAERVGRLEASVERVVRQNETTNDYLHTLIEKHLS